MKKLISVLTVLVLLVTMLPAETLAGENFDSLMQLEKLTYISSLSGMEEGAPAWHEGMGISASMHAGQVEEALQNLLDTMLLPALRQAEDLYAHAVQTGEDPGSLKEIQALIRDMRLTEDAVDKCLDTVNYQRGYIFYQSGYLKDGVYTTEREMERVAYSVLTGLDALENAIAEAARHYEEWQAQSKRFYGLSFPDNESAGALLQGTSGGLENQIIKMRTARMNDLAATAKKLKRQEATNDQDIVVDVVTVDEVRVYVRTAPKTYVSGAKVWMWKNGSKQGDPKITNEEGYASFATASFAPDEDTNIDIGYEIQLDGYRTHYAAPNWHLGGDIIYATMEANVPGEDTYIAGISFNGRDALWSERTIYITPKNDADQTLTVELRSQTTGGAPQTASALTMTYETEAGTQAMQVSAAAGQSQANFIDLWCQKLLPDQSNAFSFNINNANSTFEMPMTTREAFTQEPQYIQNAQVLTYFAIPGISTTIPGNVPVLSGSTLTLNLPFPQFTAYFNIDGDWMIGFGNSETNLNKKLDNALSKWKTDDQHFFDSVVKYYAKETGKSSKEASEDVMRMVNDTKSNFLLGSVKSFWTINGMAGGHVAPGNNTKNTSSILINFMVGVKGSLHKMLFLPTPMPIPFEIEFGFSVAGGALVKTTATYVGPPVPAIPTPPFTIAFQDWKFTSFNVDLIISISLSLSFGIGSSIRGTKYLRLGTGVRGIAMTTIQVPLLPGSISQDDFSFNFTGKISVYVDILFLTLTFDLVKGSITYENKKWGDWQKNSVADNLKAANFEGADKARLLAAGDTSDPYFPDVPETEGDFTADHSFIGDAEWNYSRYSDGTKPYYFTLRHGNNTKESVFSVWAEDEKTVKYAKLDPYDAFAHTLKMPDEVQRALDLGVWKVISVRASASPEIQDVDISVFVSHHTEQIQVGAISVVCATEWETQEVEVTEGLTTTMEVPTKTTVVSMLVCGYEDSMITLDFYDSSTRTTRPAVFVIPLDYGITDVMPMPINVQLKQPPQDGTLYDPVCVVPEGRIQDYYIMHVGTEASTGESCYFIQHDDEDKDVAMRWLPYETRPVKMMVSGGGILPVDFILTEDGVLNTVSAARTEDEVYQLRNITDFTVITTSSVKNESAKLTIFCLVEEEDGKKLKGVTTTLDNAGILKDTTVTDYDVQINASAIFSGELLGEDYVYWFEQTTVKPQDGQETATEDATLVKAFCYAPARNLTTDPFTMGKLVGSDGTVPTGYDFASQPLVAQTVPARNAIMITKAWLRESSEEQDASFSDTRYTTYEVDTAKQIINEIVGAVSENPAVTAGRSGNIEFTVANQGNTPIVGFDMDVFWLKNDTERKRIETVHVDLLDPTKNYVIHMEDDADATLNANSAGYTQEGDDGIRRIGGLFDTDNADTWNVTRSSSASNGNSTEFISLPVLMPTGVHTYLLSYNVPATWSGKHRLEIGIVKAYIPLKVSSLFDAPASASSLLTAGIDSAVLAVGADPNSENALISLAGTVHSFAPVTEAQLLLGASDQQALMDRLGLTDMQYEGGNDILSFDTAELSTSYRLYEDNGQTYVTFTVQREGETDNDAARGVTISAWLPGESSPTFRHTFRTPMTGREEVYHITLPVTKLTRGRYVDLVYVGVNDTAEGNEELTDYNNIQKLVLNQSMKITQQPQPVTVTEGENAAFQVEVKGGKAPYVYQWQILKNGVWQNIPGAKDAVLSLQKVALSLNGASYRCVISDGSRVSIASNAAQLTVLRKVHPVTGDAMPLTEITLLSVCMLGLLLLLKKKARAGR